MDVIKETAKKHKVSQSSAYREMSLAILAAKSNPDTREMWNKLFPDDKTPTVEEFISTIANYAKSRMV